VEMLSGSWRLLLLWLLSVLIADLTLYSLGSVAATGYTAPTYALMGYLFIGGLRDKQQYIPHALSGLLLFFMLTSLFGMMGSRGLGVTELVGFVIGAIQALLERRRPVES